MAGPQPHDGDRLPDTNFFFSAAAGYYYDATADFYYDHHTGLYYHPPNNTCVGGATGVAQRWRLSHCAHACRPSPHPPLPSSTHPPTCLARAGTTLSRRRPASTSRFRCLRSVLATPSSNGSAMEVWRGRRRQGRTKALPTTRSTPRRWRVRCQRRCPLRFRRRQGSPRRPSRPPRHLPGSPSRRRWTKFASESGGERGRGGEGHW